MKLTKSLFVASLFLAALIVGAAQSVASELVKGSIKDGRGEDARYIVYLPTGYEDGTESYPVLYLLHGLSDDEKTWSSAEKGQMQGICDKYFEEKPDRKRIIVMPDARATWYRDSFDDGDKFETFFFETLIPTIEKEFRCKTDKENRAVAGLSMGGYGTLLYALHHPDLFSAAYAMSPAVGVGQRRPGNNEENAEARRAYAEANDAILLLDKLEDKNAVRFTIDCGDDDFCLQGAYAFFQKARALKVPCELRVRNGVHSWDYWRVSLPKALDFISGDLP
ncbi:MAG: esterase family protein [Thermoguttaceae bacterium]|nr:esterase family protein [Thermoguttaceae bacterium]